MSDQSDIIHMIWRTLGLEPRGGSVTPPGWCPRATTPPREGQARGPLGLTPYEIRERTGSVADQAHPGTPAHHERQEEQESAQTASPSLGACRGWRHGTGPPRPVSPPGSLVHALASSLGSCCPSRRRRVGMIRVVPTDGWADAEEGADTHRGWPPDRPQAWRGAPPGSGVRHPRAGIRQHRIAARWGTPSTAGRNQGSSCRPRRGQPAHQRMGEQAVGGRARGHPKARAVTACRPS